MNWLQTEMRGLITAQAENGERLGAKTSPVSELFPPRITGDDMRMTHDKHWTTIAIRGQYRYVVPYHPYRVQWIKTRNGMVDVLRWIGIPIEKRCAWANAVMFALLPRPKYLYDRRNIRRMGV